MAIISPLFETKTATELLKTRSFSIQKGLVRSTEPDKQTQDSNDDYNDTDDNNNDPDDDVPTCQRYPESDLILNHHISRHCCTTGRLQVLGAAFLIWFTGEHVVGVIKTWTRMYNFGSKIVKFTNIWIYWAVLPWPELCCRVYNRIIIIIFQLSSFSHLTPPESHIADVRETPGQSSPLLQDTIMSSWDTWQEPCYKCDQ